MLREKIEGQLEVERANQVNSAARAFEKRFGFEWPGTIRVRNGLVEFVCDELYGGKLLYNFDATNGWSWRYVNYERPLHPEYGSGVVRSLNDLKNLLDLLDELLGDNDAQE